MRHEQLDLRLLIVFDAVLAERSVTRAARRVHLSQSATSKALNRLRDLFGDPLFLRTGNGVVPTHKALELASRIRHALQAARSVLAPQEEFDPKAAVTSFNIAMPDYVSFVLLPALLPMLARTAPGIRIVVHDLDTATAEAMLSAGKVDLALVSVARVTKPLYRQELFEDHYVCIAGEGRAPRLRVTLKQFIAARHLAVPRQNGGGMAVVDDALAQRGLSRDTIVSVPHFLCIPQVLVRTDLMATVASRIAQAFAATYPIRIYPHPVELAPFSVSQVWHARTEESLAHRWLRAGIAKLCKKT